MPAFGLASLFALGSAALLAANAETGLTIYEDELEYLFGRSVIRLEEMTPLRILVEVDLAVIQLIVHTVMSTDGGPDEESWVGWTDIMKRDNGEWRWIADRGHWIKGEPGGS